MPAPNCYACRHRRALPGDTHSSCQHPKVAGDMVTQIVQVLNAQGPNPLGVTGDTTAIELQYFFWPMNYDPIWLLTCDGFEKAA